jgi:L-asparaginase / beta-aspartyl-peptidase
MSNNHFKDFDFGILIHGGSHTRKIERIKETKISLQSSISCGFDLLKNGNSAVDAVESAVASMEDSGLFNAGVGSCLTIDKAIEMDASIMDGRDISVGSVGMVQGIRNPIKLARQIMERSDHVMIVSDGVTKILKLLKTDIEEYHPDINETLLKQYNRLMKHMKKRWKKNSKLLLPYYTPPQTNHQYYGTVGAVAIDKDGNVASAVSTGGRWLKMSGRIGDSAVVGAGFYADNRLGAACATGYGEYMMRLCLCKYACDQMQFNDALLSSKKSVQLLTERFGGNTGGIITVDQKGRFGIACNTLCMPTALISSRVKKLRLHLNITKA